MARNGGFINNSKTEATVIYPFLLLQTQCNAAATVVGLDGGRRERGGKSDTAVKAVAIIPANVCKCGQRSAMGAAAVAFPSLQQQTALS